MNNASCDIIRDLLPLYHDGVCSEASSALVRAHIDTCPDCRDELAGMDETVPTPVPDEDRALKAVGKAWGRARRRSFRKGLAISGGIFLSCALLVGVFFCFFSVERMIGVSMEPTVSRDSLCVFRRGAEPARGDIIAAPPGALGIEHFIDIVRIVGCPGDTVEIEDGALLINGEADDRFPAGTLEPGDRVYPVLLGPEEYFVLGDNHANSMDSRFLAYGQISRADIIGVCVGKLP